MRSLDFRSWPSGRAINYFEANKEIIKYDEYSKIKLPIGSGIIESACKNVIERIKRGFRIVIAFEQVYRGKKIKFVRKLFQEYSDSLGFDLCFQNFKEEMETLPGEYSPSAGSLLLAVSEEGAAGCVALRRIDNSICEMKRLYVRPAFRGRGIGKELCRRIIAAGLERGYSSMRLDTLASMSAALELYRSLGFREIESYRYNPIVDAVFMELRLE